MVDAITFVTFYTRILEDLRKTMDPIFHSVIDEMMNDDPHELVSPEQQFKNYFEMYAFVVSRILGRSLN